MIFGVVQSDCRELTVLQIPASVAEHRWIHMMVAFRSVAFSSVSTTLCYRAAWSQYRMLLGSVHCKLIFDLTTSLLEWTAEKSRFDNAV